MKRFLLTASVVAGLVLSAATHAQATFVSYGAAIGFDRITTNHPEDVGPLLQVQLGSDSDVPGYAAFQFNFAPASISANPEIASIYFEDGAYSQNQLFNSANTPFSPRAIFDSNQSSAGTQFGLGTPPTGLPGAGTVSPVFMNRANYLATAAGSGNGINPGEHALFFVKLNTGVTLADVLAAMENPVLNGGPGYELRIGLLEVNDAGGTGDGYLLHTPEPATVGVWAIGMSLMGCVAIWRRKKATS